MFRYMAFLWNARSSQQTACADALGRALQHGSLEFQEVFAGAGVRVFCAGVGEGSGASCPLAENSGTVLGTLFRKNHNCTPIRSLDADASRKVLATGGGHLVSNFWGRYIAFVLDARSGRKMVVKDPTGRLPSFYTQHEDISVFFSSLDDCMRIGLVRFAVNWPYITRQIAAGSGGPQETGLLNVREMYGGECLDSRDDSLTSRGLWCPTTIANTGQIEGVQEAASELRTALISCTGAWVACHSNILLRLSGGLDSAIVLGCLHAARAQSAITCVTYYSPDGKPELRWARLCTQGTEYRHIELARDRSLDLRPLLDLAPLPRPTSGFAYIESAVPEREIAKDVGATAVFTGDGGDSILGRYSIPYAIDDYVERCGISTGLISVASDVALLTNTSIWRVLQSALRSRWQGGATLEHAVVPAGRFLVREEIAHSAVTQRRQYQHPWFRSERTRASIQEQLTSVGYPDEFYDPLGRAEYPDPEPIYPILSQPVVEVCLRTPSYMHVERGRDRALARRAFAGHIPHKICARQWKDRPHRIAEDLLQANTKLIRETLLEGTLVREGLLDRKKLEHAITLNPEKNGAYTVEILAYLTTEAWLRRWTRVPAAQVAA